MKGDREYTLSNKQKALGIFIICLIFICLTVICAKKQSQTYSYDFDLRDIELKTAVFEDGCITSNEASSDYNFATKPLVLPSNAYKIEITYRSDVPAYAVVQGNNDCVFDIQFPHTYGADQTIVDEHMILPHGTDKGKIKFYQPENGEFSVSRISILSDKHIYNDYNIIVFLAVLVAAGLIVVILIFNRLKLTWTRMSYIGLFIITVIVVNIPFCVKGTYYEIDTQGHLKRIEAIVQGIRDRQFPVIIGPNYANQYGELVALQPGLFLYIPAFLRLMNMSVPAAYNLYLILINLATAVVALVCAERMFGTIRWGLVAAVFYLVEPFRLFVMMKLGAGAGMGTALVFLPFLVVGMHETMNKRGARWKYISVGLWGMACSHVMGFALAVIGMFIYILFHVGKLFKKEVFWALVKAALTFTVLSVGVLVPFIGYYFTKWNRSALAWTDFYHCPVEWDRELASIIALVIIVVSYIAVRQTGNLTKFGKGIFVMGFVSTIMSLSVFPWFLFEKFRLVDKFLSMMQYPLRFHFLAVPYVSYAAAEAVCSNMDSRTKVRKKVLYSIVTVFAAGVLIGTVEYFSVEKLFDDTLAGEINTVMEDYLPDGTLSEWYANDTGEFSDYDDVQAYSYSKVNTHIDCSYTSASEGQYMEFPLFFYKGYAAYDQDGNRLRVEQGTHNRVRVFLTKSDDIQEIHLRFEVRRSYTILFVFSMAVGAIWLGYNIVELTLKAVRSKRITR